MTKDIAVAAGNERDGIARSHRASSSSCAVDVCIERFGHVVVDDVRYAININTTSSDVGCNHHSILTITKSIEGVLALTLREVAVERCSVKA
jgi:hypothetical protein